MKKFADYTKYVEFEPSFCPVMSAIADSKLKSLTCFTQISDSYTILVVSGKKADVEKLCGVLHSLSLEAKKHSMSDDTGIIYWAAQIAGSYHGLYFGSDAYDKAFTPSKKEGFSLGAKVIKRTLSN